MIMLCLQCLSHLSRLDARDLAACPIIADEAMISKKIIQILRFFLE